MDLVELQINIIIIIIIIIINDGAKLLPIQSTILQTEGLAMGAPTSNILAEVYIQYTEHKKLYPILKKHQIIEYFRYVANILKIYNQNKTNIEDTLTEFNKQPV
jgi:hypothetical protein